jgi:hypothetical protein
MPTENKKMFFMSLLILTSLALIQALNSTFFIFISSKLAQH